MASVTCTISPEVVQDLKRCRLGDPSANMLAYVARIDGKTLEVVRDKELAGTSFEDLADELPEDSPRYVVLSYRHAHSDGHVSYPLVFIYYKPETAPTRALMLYASTLQLFANEGGLGAPHTLACADGLTQEWLEAALAKFSS
ncbi:hypothetical protein H4R18_000682 [Coemansia javaensis]|uniref:ADF-H domain-containing protein n=1 Tax=Coemansia javaensis TaxID=2761396 RepID=A0A9W8HM16_9FUNG|nr:hypothetical protein H4R18_000682 [Coemansia javaensis]